MECLEYSSPSWTRTILANGQAVKWAKAKVCVYADSVLCVGQVKDISGATERWNGQVEDLKMDSSYRDAVGLDGEPIEIEWTNSKDSRHYLFFARSRTAWSQRTSSQKTSRNESASCQCSKTLGGKRMTRNVFRMPKKSRFTPLKFLQGHWTFLGPGSDEKWCGGSHDQKGQWNCTSTKMGQRFKETGHPIFNSTNAFSRGNLKQRRGRCTIHFNGDFLGTTLVPNGSLCQSAQCPRSSCELVFSIRFDRGRKRTSRHSCGQ